MAQYQIVNPIEATIDVSIVDGDGNTDKISVQPRGRPKIPVGWRVTKEFQLLYPQVKVYEIKE
jgi:hypothetical protein